MVRTTNTQLTELIDDLRKQVAALNARVERLECPKAAESLAPPPQAQAASPARPPEISEEELIAISAAVAAYMGVRAHIRQIRLIGSRVWAQEGRVSIQASHRLYS
jgi:methylmalonyl-CoA carboxyltransferase 12S subunit